MAHVNAQVTFQFADRLIVTLTEEGAKVLNAHYEAKGGKSSYQLRAGGLYVLTFWQIVQIFGPVASEENVFFEKELRFDQLEFQHQRDV